MKVELSGLDAVLNQLHKLGKEGDKIAREAATRAATLVRQNFLVGLISEQTGISRSVIMRYTYIKRATPKYEHARINFSGAGIEVGEYRYQIKKLDATRARILVDWLGGMKIAAGFVNPSSKNKHPLRTRSHKTSRSGKGYSYETGLSKALGPSLATAYLAIPSQAIDREAQKFLGEELINMLDDLLGDE